MQVEIDKKSGFCFGVVKAIEIAEKQLKTGGALHCIGDIVHNEREVCRLQKLGLHIISANQLRDMHGQRVLIRAHGEPPSTYKLAQQFGIQLVDATCPVVLKLQQHVKTAWERLQVNGGTVLLYGKKGHAEVIGLLGQTNGQARVVETVADLDGVDFSRPIELFSQTTKEQQGYAEIAKNVQQRMAQYFTDQIPLVINSTICGQVAHRKAELEHFARSHDTVLFVGGKKSSNAQTLFCTCRRANPRSHFVTTPQDITREMLQHADTVGICGATSTPQWLMNDVAKACEELCKKLK